MSKTLLSILLNITLFACLLGNAGVLEAAQCSSLLEEARQTRQKSDFVNALGLWDQYLQFCFGNVSRVNDRENFLLALEDFETFIANPSDVSDESNILEVDFYLDRGLLAEASKQWLDAEAYFNWILQRYPENASALYNLGVLKLAETDWEQALGFFNQASLLQTNSPLALSSAALTNYQLGYLDQAESKLREVVLKYPMFADARAALSALLWHKGSLGEAKSHWAAAVGLDNRYQQKEWLLTLRRWPPLPIEDLFEFLALEYS